MTGEKRCCGNAYTVNYSTRYRDQKVKQFIYVINNLYKCVKREIERVGVEVFLKTWCIINFVTNMVHTLEIVIDMVGNKVCDR